MTIRKIIINEEIDKSLALVCDAALKYGGIQINQHVNAIGSAIVEEKESETPSS